MYFQAVEFVEKYDKDEIYEAISREFELLNICDDFYDGIRVLIKPNLLSDADPYFAITTNPVVVEAIVDWLLNNGVKNIVLADSPGGALSKMPGFSYDSLYEKTGFSTLKEKICLNKDSGWRRIVTPSGCENKHFNILNAVADADYIINVPKLKTHNLTTISFGIKNMFGCIPDIQKPAYHAKYPNTKDFSNMLVEFAITVKPSLTVIDAVEIMEGNGPVYGNKKKLGFLFASKDLFSQDNFVAELLGIDVQKVDMLINAKQRMLIKKATVVSDSFKSDSRFESVLLPESIRSSTFSGRLNALVKIQCYKAHRMIFHYSPTVNKDKCIRCCRCAESCPKKAISISDFAEIDYNKCIDCFCCSEVCPNQCILITKKIKIRGKRS